MSSRKTALVTGAASGMGRIYARRLAAQGARVAIFDVNQDGLDAIAAESQNLTGFRCDIASLEDVNARVADVETALGPVDLLVHAAALMPAYALADHSHEDMERLFRINYFGTTYMVQAVLPAMLERGGGTIVNVASVSGIAGRAGDSAYSTSKAAVVMLTRTLAAELGPRGIRINCVAPGAVATASVAVPTGR